MTDTYRLFIGEENGFTVNSYAQYFQSEGILHVLPPVGEEMVPRKCHDSIEVVAANLSDEFRTVVTVVDDDGHQQKRPPILIAERGTVFYPKSYSEPAYKALANLCANLYRVYIRAVELRLAEEWQWAEYAIMREQAEKALSDACIPVTPEFFRAQRLAVMREYVKDGVSKDVCLGHKDYHAGDYIRLRVERPDADGGATFETGIIIRVVPGAEFCPFHVYDVVNKSVVLLAEIPPQDEASLIALYEQDIENRIAQYRLDQANEARDNLGSDDV